jgi:hypothetical protein
MGYRYETILMSEEACKMFFTPTDNVIVREYGAYICMTLDLLRVSCITEETLPEIKIREAILEAISDEIKDSTGIKWETFMGLHTNVEFEIRSKFITRISQHQTKLSKRDINRIRENHYNKINEAKRQVA